ncbi:MAG: cysteine hydrolase [Bifidobacteriaceae bacterium]|nr:cysteine hydrolase [Bifidobacteriaceae bacterium]
MSSAKPAQLAVIDMQRVFNQPGSPWQIPRLAAITEPILRLVQAHQPNVVFTRFLAPAQPTGAWVDYYAAWPFAMKPADHPMWRISAPLVDAARASGPTLDKSTFSKWGPELAELVGPGGRLVLAGVSTDCCVLATALAAADAGVEVRVVAEACAGLNDLSHDKALRILGLLTPLIKVISLEEALAQAV